MKAEDYTEGEAFQAEKRSLFGTGWLPVCAMGQVSKPGDFLSVTVGGWSVVAIRGEDGAVRVLRNACRHQNMPVVGTPSGNCQNLRCRFHGWTYDLQGRFQSAPPQFAPPPTQTERDLLSLATAGQQGLMFFSMAQPSASPSLEALPDYRGTLVSDVPANWKVVVEHLLADRPASPADFAWLPPLLAIRRSGSTAVVEQIVPHTFLRTRLFTHVFGDQVFGDAVESRNETMSGIAAACERLQAQRAEGQLAAGDDALVASFHKTLDEVYAGNS
jgi:nitrite reductase/ring-hydroxylating ferredoxin subunit